MTPPLRYKHLMIDIETMGTDRKAPVLAIGAVPFQLHREHCAIAPSGHHWEIRLTLEANEQIGRRANPATVEWWLRQSDAARAALLAEPRCDSATDFAVEFLRRIENDPVLDLGELHLWAKPPQFDIVILQDFLDDALPAFSEWPAPQRLERDSRPLIDLAKAMGWNDCFPAPVVEHGALSDAVEQAEQVVRIWRRATGWCS